MNNYQVRTLLDAFVKYAVLLIITFHLGSCIQSYLITGVVVNMPDWIVSLFTIIFVYFFRKSPEKEKDNG